MLLSSHRTQAYGDRGVGEGCLSVLNMLTEAPVMPPTLHPTETKTETETETETKILIGELASPPHDPADALG